MIEYETDENSITRTTYEKDDPVIYKILHENKEMIFSNVLTGNDNNPYWLGMGIKTPKEGSNHSVTGWHDGKKDDNGKEITLAHSNARYTIRLEYLDNIDIFYILLLGPLFGGFSVITYPLIYYFKRTKRIFVVSTFISIANLLITLFMVRGYMQMGAAISFLAISMITLFVYIVAFYSISDILRQVSTWIVTVSIYIAFGVGLFYVLNSAYVLVCVMLVLAMISFKKGSLKGNVESFFKNYISLKSLRQNSTEPIGSN